MKSEAKLVEIGQSSSQKIAKELTENMREELEELCERFSNSLSGFVMICWSNIGETALAFNADNGPVADSLVPTFVHDVISRAVTVKVTERRALSGSS
jgi:hypothetical protein